MHIASVDTSCTCWSLSAGVRQRPRKTGCVVTQVVTQAGGDHVRRSGGDRLGFASDQPREPILIGFPFWHVHTLWASCICRPLRVLVSNVASRIVSDPPQTMVLRVASYGPSVVRALGLQDIAREIGNLC